MLESLEQTSIAAILRQSLWLYPFVNIGHILGISLLFTSVLVIDLRILGLWTSIRLKEIIIIQRPLLLCGLFLAIFFGLLLFITAAVDYISSRIFMIKMLLLIAAIFNAAIFLTSNAWSQARQADQFNLQAKGHALVSLILWLLVIIMGRFIAYR